MKEIIKEYVNPELKKDNFSTRWWLIEDKKQHEHIFPTVSMLEEKQRYRTEANVKHARLYANLELLGIYGGIYTTQKNDPILSNSIRLNVTKSCIDTVVSKIAKSKPRPMFLTEGGDFKVQNKAKQLTKYLDGAFQAMGLYEEKQLSFLDACTFGTGAVKFYKDTAKKQVSCERTIIEELLTDDTDSIYGRPKVLFQRRLVSKDVLKGMFPKFKSEIDHATNGLTSAQSTQMTKDLVKVIEAWHLPSQKDAGDGVHTMCIDTATLLVEDYDKEWFPFVFDKWNPRLTGFWGMGLAEELVGIQIEINKILRNIQLAMHLVAVPRVFVENNSQVNTSALNNDIAAIIKYSGATPPTFHSPQAMSADVYSHLWNLVNKAYEITGISQLSASSQKPAGLNSGVALREYQDIESDRFQMTAQRFEKSFLDAAKIVIEFTKDMAKTEKLSIKVADSGSMKTIKWNEIDLDEDKYLMRVFPTSLLPTTPAGKLQTVSELVQAGFLDQASAFDLLDFPDLQAVTGRILAPKKVVFKLLDEMVETGEYQPPEPYMDLQAAQNFSQQYYMDAKIKGVPEDRLELLRTFIDQCKMQIGLAQEAAQAQAMAMQQQQMAATATPQQAPRSDLMPLPTQAQ